ncbi:DUF7677 family protein [Parafrankia soli]
MNSTPRANPPTRSTPSAERRAALWLYRYCTGRHPSGEPELEPWECELH